MRPGYREHERRENNEWEILLARVLELPQAEQLRIHRSLSDVLGGALPQETERARQTRMRQEALEAMRAAAEHLQLPNGQAPTIPEFKRAAQETKLPLTFNAVYQAFEENWNTATRFYRGEKIPATAAHRSSRRAILGRNRTDKEAPITCLRLFLSQEPPPKSLTRDDYQEWAREYNENLPRDAKRLVENAGHIKGITRTSWKNCLAIARNEMTPEEAQEQELAQQLSESGPLVGHYLASWVLGVSAHARHARGNRAGYPQPVVCLGKTNWLWLLSDIRAYGQGRRDFTHAKGSLQHVYVDSSEMARLLQITVPLVTSRVMWGYANKWEHVPPPTGKAGKRIYWERAQVERWLPKHSAAIGAGPRGRPRNGSRTAVSGVSGLTRSAL